MLKRTFLAASAVIAFALPVSAGGLADPVLEPEIIIETIEEPSSSAGTMLPFIMFGLFAAIASS